MQQNFDDLELLVLELLLAAHLALMVACGTIGRT
jgi:hypothetical protein